MTLKIFWEQQEELLLGQRCSHIEVLLIEQDLLRRKEAVKNAAFTNSNKEPGELPLECKRREIMGCLYDIQTERTEDLAAGKKSLRGTVRENLPYGEDFS